MCRFCAFLAGVLALTLANAIAVSPASALSGAAYDKCMANCKKNSPKANACDWWCQKKNY